MTENPTHPDLAYHLRRLIEAVKGACAEERRWGWLAGPVALLTWIRTRRMRREREAALEQFKGMLEGLLGLLEDFRAGRLPTQTTPEVHEAGEAVNGAGAVAYPSPRPTPTRGEGEEDPSPQPSPTRGERLSRVSSVI
jgi:hypothetical protein